MWTQDAELAWDKLEEQVYTVEKMQEINLGTGHLSYWCDPEGENVHDCSIQKTIMLKDGWYGHWKVRMKLLVRGINDAVWIAVKTGWEEPTILQQRGRSPSLMSQYKEWFESLICNQAGGEVVTFWSKECIFYGGEEHGDGRPDVDGDYLVGGGNVCQRVNQEACGVVETMWTQDAELAWDKLDQVYTVEKRQEINLESKFMS
ncbi:hypothetical protein F2Q68_00016365 [Brassica cretica]|uniref:Uncharacterized protein n=1 Tax=Brassica cretica TaxID=69181 RepID=A0A8S9HJ32_BRACR|nr:hypothetical protein F2Q68_00016365 [Brassica cretica]